MPESRLREVATLFLRLGFTAFGGPAAHVAMMEDEVVRRRQWIDRGHFMDLLSAINFIPGPNSTELAIHLGYIRAGWRGLIVGGVCFIVPAVLIILPLAWMYVTYGSTPRALDILAGIQASVLAIIAAAMVRLARTSIKDVFCVVIAVLSVIAGLAGGHYWPSGQIELLILLVAAITGAIWYNRPRGVLPALLPMMFWNDLGKLLLVLLKIGATLFGSGYVLISYLQRDLVETHHWLTSQQLLDAIAVGQVTPGPLLTTATFVGFVAGHTTFAGGVSGGIVGAILCTIAIFLPSFILIALVARVIDRIRTNRFARGALDAVNAAVVALILVVLIRLTSEAVHDVLSAAIAIASLGVLLVWNLNSTWIVLGAALVALLAGMR